MGPVLSGSEIRASEMYHVQAGVDMFIHEPAHQ